ncbi:MAG: 16S rRNA (cytidine(1402)-2'-O)-methyltransferase [Nitrospirae bacterium]|nr:16S rRNA (cytidine(1402)-2'-O)-methyltransferase [Nitrospirota bacterium]
MSGGTLYIVATPIGNLDDITLRALKILKEVDYIAAEDTRHSLKLLNSYGIRKPLISYWSEREKIKAEEIVSKLREGSSVAVISDAGTPGISDPGAVVIRRAIEEGITVVPVPGPSALTAALSISGLSTEEFTFIGFLPSKTVQRQKELVGLKYEPRTLVFYEAPHRLLEALLDMETIFGPREAVVVKEITKLHEATIRGTLTAVREELEHLTIAGEYVILVEGKRLFGARMEEALSEIKSLMKKGRGRKEAVKVVADEYGLSRKELYDKSLGVE